MVFLEKKKENGFGYRVEDVFGVIEIHSVNRLNNELLDDIVMVLLNGKANAKEIKGEVKTEKGLISYKFIKTQVWSDDDEKEQCENTPTSTKKPAKEYIVANLLKIRTINWLWKFAGAFKEALKKANK